MHTVTVYRVEGKPLSVSDAGQLRRVLLTEIDTVERQARDNGLDEPLWPMVQLHADDGIVLTVALRRDRGALLWIGQHGENDVTSGGVNDSAAIYYDGGHDSPVPPHSELPLTKVLDAAAEFLDTGRRPTNVYWQDSNAAWSPVRSVA
jgi:hypothetical protein